MNVIFPIFAGCVLHGIATACLDWLPMEYRLGFRRGCQCMGYSLMLIGLFEYLEQWRQ